jgi:hypothetical protein
LQAHLRNAKECFIIPLAKKFPALQGSRLSAAILRGAEWRIKGALLRLRTALRYAPSRCFVCDELFVRHAVSHYFKDALRAPFFGGGKKNFLLQLIFR